MKKLIVFLILMLSSTAVFSEKAALFISLGMPDQVIKSYFVQAKEYAIPVVIRGLYTKNRDNKSHTDMGSVRDTTNRLKEMMGEEKTGGVSIDPTLFKSFGVGVVPALVVYDEDNSCRRKEGQSYTLAFSDCFDVAYGNLPLRKMLARVAEESHSIERASFAKNKLGLILKGEI